MVASYVAANDPYGPGSIPQEAYREGLAVTPDDNADQAKYALIYCITAGTVKLTPARNDDADTIAMTVPVGWQSPWLVRKLFNTGTTAVFRTLGKAF